MERQLWIAIVACLRRIDKSIPVAAETYTDARILEVHFWAVLHDRPMSWACNLKNWPPASRRHKPLPSDSCMSRRLKTERVLTLLAALEEHVVRRPAAGGLVWFLDGKPLTISGVSKDRQAGYGRAAAAKAKGYKIHAIVGVDNTLAAWRLAPMNVDERVMAERLLRTKGIQGYVVSDANYDSNRLHAECDLRGDLQLVAPRRYGPGRGHGHRKQRAGRLRSKAILENPQPQFGRDLLRQRGQIERYFGQLTSWGGGLTHLPPWVRTYRRVHRWVRAKLIAAHTRRGLSLTT